MATVDFANRTLSLHLCWFGPTQSGCGTNVRQLHRLLRAREKTDLRRVGGGKDRTERSWQFRCQPEGVPPLAGWEIVVHLCSVPGGEDVALDRDALLRGVDGLVFVADARAHRAQANLGAIIDLERLLLRQGLALADLPLMFQVNQTDAANARPAARVLEDLDPFGMPWFEAMARQGRGVKETWDGLLAAVGARLRDNLPTDQAVLPLTAVPLAERDIADSRIARHVGALPGQDRDDLLGSVLPPTAEIVLRSPDLQGQTPLRHVRSSMQGNRLRVEGVFRKSDGDLRKLALLIEAGSAAPEQSTHSAIPIAQPPVNRVPLAVSGNPPGELPRLAYGVLGTAAGIVSGLSLGYLLFV